VYAVLKNTLLAGAAASMFAVITVSGSKTGRLLPEKPGKEAINPFIKTTVRDTPPEEGVTNDDLHYPIRDNDYGEPIYNPKAPMQLNSPSNIKTTTTYNPKDSSYTFEQKMGALDYRPPINMSDQDYRDYQFKQQVKNYWKSRTQADSKSDPTKKQLIPQLKVGGELFDRLFGGNTVDIRPTGSAELLFGVITNRNENPAIPQKQRKISNFDFNMKIQLNIVGKIGEKLKLTTNYNTEASFDFENQIKIQYTGTEDEILKKVEAGNVNLPLNSSLITGSQTLFGVKATLQFGKLTATLLAAQERGKKTELNVQNGAQTMTYTVQADNYEANRHYFLAQYFRDNYNQWLANTPIVQSPIQITKIEVYVTNRTSQFEQARNIAAFADLGEDTSHIFYQNTHNGSLKYNITDTPYTANPTVIQTPYPRNSKNSLYKNLLDTFTVTTGTVVTGEEGPLRARSYNTAVANLTAIIDPLTNQQVFNAGREFEVLTRARRLNPATDYYLNPRLGYISLNTALNYDEVLSVSYQYMLNGRVYQVGEFSDQFPSTDQLIVTKLLKSTQLNTQIPMWDLMMKNVYTLGAYSLSPTNFQLNVFYNNIKTGVDIPYIPYGSMNGHLLIQELHLDNINQNQDRVPDGYFDFIPNVTVNPQNGRIYFTTKEPFGNDLKGAFSPDELQNHLTDVNGFIFQELYDSTKISAQQLPNKDRFKLKGSYQSATSNEFSLNSMNIPQGSVRVTAGGVALTENVDYTVDYTMGKVKIINESVLNSGQAIKITAENNSLFNVQQKSMYGARFDYKYSKDLALGGTILHYGERPLTQKVNIGDEPVSNTMIGIDYNYRANAPWLTRLIDKIPLIQTKEPSSIQISGEGADLIPGHSSAISNNGGTSYIDDFEGSVSTIDLRSATAWFHSSIPEGQPNLFPETLPGNSDSIKTGLNRAKIAWYTVDQSVFYQSTTLTPPQAGKQQQSNHFMEAFFESDLFPKKTPPNGQPQLLPMLDVAFYPNERGPYNYDTKPTHISAGINVAESNIEKTIILNKPETRWGGIMRSLTTNDFQASNIEYIQFWMMDPFNEDYNNQTQTQYNTFHQAPPTNGELYFNLGSVSEDILKDGSMAYENGIPSPSGTNYSVQNSPWGRYPSSPPYVNAFDIDPNTRPYQDVGYDCIGDGDEASHFSNYKAELTGLNISGDNEAYGDPSGDNYHFYRGDDYDKLVAPKGNLLYRYKKYNNVEGNSPTQAQYQTQNAGGYSTVSITTPNIEDVNKDNTLNQSESYYQYKIKVTPQDINPGNVGNNYIVNYIPVSKQGADGVQRTVNFYQFKIPITDFNAKIGGISGYNAIRFMRMFTKSFSAPVIMRFARLELVRSDWRVYQENLSTPTGGLQTDNQTEFDVSAVSYQENGTRTPIDYVLPPGINQQQNVQTTNLVLLNEQSLSLRVSNLKDGDARAVYKNITSLDARSYQKIRMYVHAEKLNNQPLNDGDVHMFVRLGSDFTNNYYVYEVPVKLTAPGNYDNGNDNDKSKVWPSANEVVLDLAEITGEKIKRNLKDIPTTGIKMDTTKTETGVPHLIGVVGEPNMGAITNVMIGILNPLTPADPKSMTAEIWVDELRVTDFNQHGGQAAISKVTAKLADFGQVSLSGQVATPFFGSIDAKPSDRSRQSVKQYAMNGTFQLGKFLPKDWKINLPIYIAQSETYNTPQYDPTNGDVLMSNITVKNGFTDGSNHTPDQIGLIKNRAVDYTRQRGINFTNVSKQRSKNKTKMYPWDIENISVTYAYTEQYKRNVTTAFSFNRNYNGLLNYNYQAPIKSFEPFKNSKAAILQSPWLALIKDINIKPLPGQFNFSNSVTRTYIESCARDISSEQSGQPDYTRTQYNKTFNVTRNYSTRWDLTKNIKLDLTATNLGRVLEDPKNPGSNITTADKQLVEKNLFQKGGTNTNYNQTTNVNVLLPLNKIPLLDFITQASGKYTANYQWQRRPFAVDTIGNTIQNAQTQAYTTQLNMVNLYNKIPYLKRINQNLPRPKKDKKKEEDKKKADGKTDPKDPQADKNKPPANNTVQTKPDTSKKKDSNPLEIFDHIARILMTVKQISANYNITQGTTLPGFAPSASILGMSNSGNNNTYFGDNSQYNQLGAPGLGFVFGGNQGKMATKPSDIQSLNATGIVKDAEHNNWLVHRQNFSTQYLHTKTQTFNYSANVEPIKSLKITLTGNMTHGQTESYFIGYDSTDRKYPYKAYTPVFGGNYSISTITLSKYSFSKDDAVGTHNSTVFDNYLLLTQDYAGLLSHQNHNSLGKEGNHYDGYSYNQQDVAIGAFISAYTGHKTASANNTGNNLFKKIPLPGWSLTYDGFGKMAAVKKYFKSVVLTHGYRSTLSYGSYTNNQAYGEDPINHGAIKRTVDSVGSTSNFVSQYVMNTITVSESFSPLIKVNFMFVDKGKIKGLGANFEIKKDHISTLSSNVPQVMDLHSSEYNIGATYTLPQVEIKRLKIRGKPLKSDLLSTVTLSFRQTQTALRKGVDVSTPNGDALTQVSQVSAGQNITTIKVSLTYSLTQNVNLRIYYDRTINKPVISTSFPTQTTNAGLSLRFVIQ
jgi:cell surface protein SprA